jgi:hypothetical protein
MSGNKTGERAALIQKLKGLKVNTQATLVCLAEEAFRSGDRELYLDLKSLSDSLNYEAEKVLSRYGATTPPKAKPKLRVVK